MKFSQKYITSNKLLNDIHVEATSMDALQAFKSTILSIDSDAFIGIDNTEQCITWSSRKLVEAIKITALDSIKGCELWFEFGANDQSILSDAIHLFESLSSNPDTHRRSTESTSAIEVLNEFLANQEWLKYVDVLPSAIKSAKDSPYTRFRRLREVLENLAIFSLGRNANDFTSLNELAADSGLGNTYRPNISITARSKYRSEYEYNYGGERFLMCEHLTLGGGCNDRQCLSIHFFWDDKLKKIIIGHIGRHGTNTLTNT